MVIMSSKHLNAQYNLRWPDELKEKIAQSAKEHNRSMNADIVARLEESFEVNQQQESTITDLTDQIKHLKMSFDILSEALREKKTP